ncbi:isocitrate lyase/phosphoenolpyruvate mutase family protein [Pedobacter chinensis]|uniref:Isocitrate lyase/phosphoenolpyruvate mutase family protein n=1 Tax=Pedobacter chinensis TaxID=2282421 RepID=A0A369Q044_9SPHI|nr:isocitrate lyase/phosphoenolpyruvate mutase family protein [Pedobacter chinensis]RDC56309.1 isocitrate lyase/phosphoenolpyruvate mutase family protein [Pedobacter chinensis]
MTDYLKFKELHYQSKPLLLGNAWNIQSARVFEKSGFQAIGTSSAAIAHTLGYEDGQQMPFADLLFIVEKIKRNTHLPLTVDIEFGYGKTPNEVANNIEKLYQLGVAGINIEDSCFENSERKLKPENIFFHFLKEIIEELHSRNIQIFINVRCDAFLLQLPNALKETLNRIELYQQLSIDGIFIPCITSIKEMKQMVSKTKLPLNVMCMPELPGFETLSELGIKRISMGNFLNDFSYRALETVSEKIITDQSFHTLWN